MSSFLSGAHSIFSYIQATAEEEYGGLKWKTFDYSDQPHYHFNIFNGCGGIPLFLGAYYAVTGNEKALELAHGALQWCIHARPEQGNFQRGLHFGKTGVAYAALYLSEVAGGDRFFDFCLANAETILGEEPGPITDFIGGESSNGWYLLQLWKKTGTDAHLNGAIRCGQWIAQHLIRDELGTHCRADPVQLAFGDKSYSGLSHGIAGIAFFYAALFFATQDQQWKDLSNELLQTLKARALPDGNGLNWPTVLGGTELTRCQYSHGSPGIGLVFLKAAEALGDASLLATALLAGEATYHHGDRRKNPTLCTGLAGGGELLLELYRETGNGMWLERAEEFAHQALAYRVSSVTYDRWPTDTPGHYSPDFTYGAAGTGYFLLRTHSPARFGPPLM